MGAVSRLRAGRAAELGRAGELAAARLLKARGFEVVGSGFRARRGEIDLVCVRGRTLYVVEVKTRGGDGFGAPIEAVGSRKRESLRSAAAEYRALTEWRGPIRFAVVSLTVRPDGGFDGELIEDPFD
ncbi:MAG TPA: YraN family protein [Candidatus Dormibacteraeota bacterium]|nr:YraN family protein [Candidatus Dormibacteraeota bacterium]